MKHSLTKTKLHSMGYRLSKSGDCYWKRRKVAFRNKFCTIQLKFNCYLYGWFSVNSKEGADFNYSEYLKGVSALRQWEKFAFGY